MRKLLTILASISILVCAGCASNSDGTAKSPWAAGTKKPVAQKVEQPKTETPVPVEKIASTSNQEATPVAEVPATVSPATADAPLLAKYAALRNSLAQKAQRELEATKANSAPLPLPDEGKARVVAFNGQFAVVEFDTPTQFKLDEKVALRKDGAATLVKIISAEGTRYIATEVEHVANPPTLVPGDEIDCEVWVNPEDAAAVKAAAAKKKQAQSAATEAVEEDEEDMPAEEEAFEE